MPSFSRAKLRIKDDTDKKKRTYFQAFSTRRCHSDKTEVQVRPQARDSTPSTHGSQQQLGAIKSKNVLNHELIPMNGAHFAAFLLLKFHKSSGLLS